MCSLEIEREETQTNRVEEQGVLQPGGEPQQTADGGAIISGTSCLRMEQGESVLDRGITRRGRETI